MGKLEGMLDMGGLGGGLKPTYLYGISPEVIRQGLMRRWIDLRETRRVCMVGLSKIIERFLPGKNGTGTHGMGRHSGMILGLKRDFDDKEMPMDGDDNRLPGQ